MGYDESKIDTPIVVFASWKAISRYGDIARELGAIAVTNVTGEVISIISKVIN